MQIARRTIAVFTLLALLLGGLMLPAASAGHSDAAQPASSVTLVAEVQLDAAMLPSDCDHCPMEGEVLSGSSCVTAACAAVPIEAKEPALSGLGSGIAFVLRDQRLGGAAASPELQPPRPSVLA